VFAAVISSPVSTLCKNWSKDSESLLLSKVEFKSAAVPKAMLLGFR
jgi:hypothetical protein